MATKNRRADADLIQSQTPAAGLGDIDSILGDALTRRQVAEKLRVSESTLTRWEETGIQGRDGEMHKLTPIRVGLRRYYPQSALMNFLAATNAPAA